MFSRYVCVKDNLRHDSPITSHRQPEQLKVLTTVVLKLICLPSDGVCYRFYCIMFLLWQQHVLASRLRDGETRPAPYNLRGYEALYITLYGEERCQRTTYLRHRTGLAYIRGTRPIRVSTVLFTHCFIYSFI